VVFCHISKRGSKKQQKINKRCCILIAGNNLAWASTNSAPDEKRGATVGIVLTLTDLAGIFCSYRFAPFSLNSTSLAPRVLTGSSTIGVLIGCRKVEYALLRELYMWDKLPLYIHK
jgi:hypothetical protein